MSRGPDRLMRKGHEQEKKKKICAKGNLQKKKKINSEPKKSPLSGKLVISLENWENSHQGK